MTTDGTAAGSYPANWYPDPSGAPNVLRWYDGTAWTEARREMAAPAPPEELLDEPQIVAGFFPIEPIPFRPFQEVRPTDERPTKSLGLTLDRAGVAARNADRFEYWRARAAAWNEIEAERTRSARRLLPHTFPRRGLTTCHGGTFDGWCSLLFLVAAQWAWQEEPSIVIDSSNAVGTELGQFLGEMMPDALGLARTSTVDQAVRDELLGGIAGHFDLTSPLGREHLLVAMFGYADGTGINRVEDEFADYEALLRDVAVAVGVDGEPCNLSTVIDGLLLLVSPAEELQLSREQVQALDRVRRRYEESPLRNKLLARLELVSDLIAGVVGSSPLGTREPPLIEILTTDPARGSNARTTQQRLTAELALGILQTAPPDHNVALVFTDVTDHATPFLDRLSEAAAGRTGTTLVLFPRFDGNIGDWVTRSHQGGPLIQVLQDADDAERAAKYLGQQHRFMVTQRTFERGKNSSDSWNSSTSSSFGRSFSSSRGGQRSTTSGSSWNDSSSTSVGRTIGTSESESETTSRVLEFDVNPIEIQRMGATSAIIRDPEDRHPIAIDSFPLLWVVAEDELAIEAAFEQRWGLSPDEFASLPPTYATLDRLFARELQR